MSNLCCPSQIDVDLVRKQVSDERSVIAQRQLMGRLMASFDHLLRYADRYDELTVIHHHYDEFESQMFEYIFEKINSSPCPSDDSTLPFEE